jgi:hypothetical protein
MHRRKKATRRWLLRISSKTDYLLAASEAGAAASDATAAGAAASDATAAGAGAASTAAGASFLPQATRAAAANKVANKRDFFISISSKGIKRFWVCSGMHHGRADSKHHLSQLKIIGVIPMFLFITCQVYVIY